MHATDLIKALDRIHDDLKGMAEDISALKVTAAQHHVVLEEHIARTKHLEARVRPLEASQVRWAIIGKLIASVASAAGVLLGVLLRRR